VKYICLNSGFSVFTKGRVYNSYKPRRYTTLYLINDLGEESTPSISGYNDRGFVVYFIEISEWWKKQIDKIIL